MLRRIAAEGGFILLESVIAITIVTIVMGAVGVEFVSGMVSTSQQRAQQGAVQLADSTVEQIRALHASDLVTGRDLASVKTQFQSAPAAVQPWLTSTVADWAYDANAAAGSGATAAIPTAGVTQAPGNVTYTVNQYLYYCSIRTTGSTDCVSPGTLTGISSTAYLRAVVAVSWSGARCASGTCSYVTSTLVSQAADRTFRINTAPYSAPVVVAVGSQSSTIGDAENLQLTVQNGRGVPPFTWAVTAGTMPTGLTLSTTGLISGTVAGSPGTYTFTVQVTDAFLRTDTQSITWTVYSPVVATNPGVQVSTVNTAMASLQLSASGGSGGYSWSDSPSSLPAGLSISTGGAITGTPTTVGTSAVTLTVTDTATGSARTLSFSWSVVAKPTVTSPGNQVSSVGQNASVQLTTTCPNSPCSYAFGGTAPSGLAISSTGLIAGVVGSTVKTFTGITVTVTDSDGATASSASFSWTVYAALTPAIPAAQSSVVNTAITPLQLSATGGSGGYVWSDPTRTLPAGLAISSSGQITGTPTAVNGSGVTVSITVTDAAANSTKTISFTWTVGYPPLVASNPSGQASTVSTAISGLQLTVSGGSGTYTWSDAGHTLPAGLSISSAGLITGTPTATGTSSVSVTVSDGTTTKTVSFTWVVAARPTVTAPANQGSTVGSSVSLQLTTACANTPCTYTFGGTTPSGLAISSTGLINGTVGTPAATFSGITVRVTDRAGATATTAAFSWTVYTALAATAPSAQSGVVGTAISGLQLSASGGSGSYTWSDSPRTLPAGLSISASGLVTGTPTTAGSSAVSVTVTDSAANASKTVSFTWTVYTPLAGTNPGSQTSTVNTAIATLQLGATGGTGTYTWSDSPRTLPLGLSLSSTGAVTGTPTTTGTANVSVSVSDGNTTKTVAFTWTVVAKPTVTAPAAQAGSVGANVSVQLTTACPNSPCTYAFGTTRPSGVGISSSGLISGTLSTPSGTFSGVTVTVTDRAGATATTAGFTWTVYSAVAMSSPGNQTVQRGGAVSLDVSTLDSGGMPGYTFGASGLPSWLSINASTGKITGTAPTGANSTTTGIRVSVTDGSGVTATSATFKWNVTNLASSFNDVTTSDATAVSIDLDNYTTGGTGPYTYTASGLPSWLSLNGSTGVISGTSPNLTNSSVKTANSTVTVTDSKGAVITLTGIDWYNTDLTWTVPATINTAQGTNLSGYSAASYLTGGPTGTRTFSATGLPTGLTMSSTGAVTGSTSVTGTFNTVFSVTDSVGAKKTTNITWTVS